MPDDIVRTAYAAIHQLYIDSFGSPTHLDPEDTAFVLRHLTPGPTLDLGCGPGHFTKTLVDAGIPTTGIDLVPEFIAHAQSAYPDIPFEVGSITSLPVPTGTITGILAWFSLIHFTPTELPAVLAELHRALTPGGRLIAGFFDTPDTVEPFPHKVTTAYRWPIDAFAETLATAGFTELSRLQRSAADPTRPYAALATIAH
ncbi:class I SAM-dependent methyltransferase [Nocardia sp. NPDC059177]|uniref:class I SAM-dependent methyltransferase n=1 Tax=Nocardia sp. NPDC059177 TaxID=3346759 RepID=UPI0036D1CDEB